MEIIKVKTPRGLELNGALFEAQKNKEIAVIMIPGICSNIFQNDLLLETGKLLSKNGITCLVAHTMDSFSCFAYSDFSIGKQRNTGVIFDEFENAFEDVETHVKNIKSLGYKKVILAGHSLGSNKIINYLGNTKENLIDYFIISAPIDLGYWFKAMPNIKRCIELAELFKAKGKEGCILPYLFGGFSPMSAKTALEFYSADNLKNCPVISNDGETKSLHSIKINGSFIVGEKDTMTGGDAKKFISDINSYCKNPDSNNLVVIPKASHIFYGMHKEYAQEFLKCIQQHYLMLNYC